MKARAKFITNGEELDQAQDLGMSKPNVEERECDFYFDREGLSCAFIDSHNHMIVHIYGHQWLLQYDEKLWNSITEYLESK